MTIIDFRNSMFCWFSKAKPPMNSFLLPVMTEVDKLLENGKGLPYCKKFSLVKSISGQQVHGIISYARAAR